MLRTAAEVIAAHRLAAHPEGGYYREVHRSPRGIGVPAGYPGERVAVTAIYFLLEAGDFSAFHRVRGEEVWVHLAGADLELVVLEDGVSVQCLGAADRGGTPLAVVPAGVLQAARSLGPWTLMSCLVAPGFEFADFELPSRAALLARHPDHEELVRRFTR